MQIFENRPISGTNIAKNVGGGSHTNLFFYFDTGGLGFL